MFLATILSALMIEVLGRRLYPVKYDLWQLASTRAYGGFDQSRLKVPIVILCSTVFVAGATAFFKAKLVVYPTRIVSCGFFSCDGYAVDSIAEIGHSQRAVAPNGNVVETRDMFLRFQDGKLWVPFGLRNEPIQFEISKYLSKQRGAVIQQVEMRPEN